ncbi:PEPxxWA-CTERM sorting domain-containing protein [Kordiimonas sp. SCSIO 12610]|uniref:PEPxxWA-CTERM sorting domain-containing protein n=1 Tax=Kordiimonas sp. SCSIO 12610 TaxID=2829597 RepID=UPI00210A3975|nr:PEPxxWA-CTERM sorting domain-containing protein [Kordiimonas sp. SCSIO 12610]UTW56173.1 PEP-CTERM sorting domain-containing protein [Kordiimonas sp. SCSIO 12610]
MKKFFALMLALSCVTANVSAQASTFVFEGDATFRNVDVANSFGVTNGLTTNFQVRFDLDTNQPNTEIINLSGGDTASNYPISNNSYVLGNRTWQVPSNLPFFRVEDGSSDSIDVLSLTVLDAGIDVGDGIVIDFLTVFIGDTSLISNTSAASVRNFVGINDNGVGILTFFLDFPNSRSQSSVRFSNVRLSELAISAVPEPATWLMMVFGFAGVGLALKRRRRLIATT